ncbi:hypothetical protein JTB14_027150 [Gonioctena quinquepunctata]|nr:hypothetical protein JTB14_027150 [Gonioctena quinquepunctata]
MSGAGQVTYVVLEFCYNRILFISAAPGKWVEENACWWPSKKDKERKLIRDAIDPEKDWTLLKDVTILGHYDLNGTPCVKNSYFYDTSTYCQCDTTSGKYICQENNHYFNTRGGICNPGQAVRENICHKCSCTFTHFRLCVFVDVCINMRKKPGRCPKMLNFYPESLQNICTSSRYQECYTDYSCPGEKKCCHVVDCFFRCVNPE